jgi:flagellar motor switch protein FliG
MGKAAARRSGTERAAIFLMTLGEQGAAQVLKHMAARDVQRVGAAMAQLAKVSRDDVMAVLDTFARNVENETSVGIGSDDYVRKVLTDALGEEKAGGLIDRIHLGRSSKGLESLKWMEPRTIAEMIRIEHPQIIAIVLAYLEPDQAGSVLGHLPEWLRADVVLRIATLDGLQPGALSELDEIVEKQFAVGGRGGQTSLGGPKAAASILNMMESGAETTVMEHMRKVDEGLVARIEDLMIVFENLLGVDDRGMQELLRQVQSESLLLALKGADEELKAKIFRNMSQRAAEMLKDDLEARGPVRLADVEAAQKEILAVARQMASEGTLMLGGRGGQYV